MGHREEFKQSVENFPKLTTPSPYSLWLPLVLSIFLDQAFYLSIFRSLIERGKKLFLSLLGLDCLQLKIISMKVAHSGVACSEPLHFTLRAPSYSKKF